MTMSVVGRVCAVCGGRMGLLHQAGPCPGGQWCDDCGAAPGELCHPACMSHVTLQDS